MEERPPSRQHHPANAEELSGLAYRDLYRLDSFHRCSSSQPFSAGFEYCVAREDQERISLFLLFCFDNADTRSQSGPVAWCWTRGCSVVAGAASASTMGAWRGLAPLGPLAPSGGALPYPHRSPALSNSAQAEAAEAIPGRK